MVLSPLIWPCQGTAERWSTWNNRTHILCLSRVIVNVISCEGKERVERHELLGRWKSRLTMSRFQPFPLSSCVKSMISSLLCKYTQHYMMEPCCWDGRLGTLFEHLALRGIIDAWYRVNHRMISSLLLFWVYILCAHDVGFSLHLLNLRDAFSSFKYTMYFLHLYPFV